MRITSTARFPPTRSLGQHDDDASTLSQGTSRLKGDSWWKQTDTEREKVVDNGYSLWPQEIVIQSARAYTNIRS